MGRVSVAVAAAGLVQEVASRGGGGDPAQAVVTEALGVLSEIERAWGQGLAGWAARGSGPGDPVLLVIAEGLIVGSKWQPGVGRCDVPGGVVGAGLVEQRRRTLTEV